MMITPIQEAAYGPGPALGPFERELMWVNSIGYTLTAMSAAAGLWLALEAKRTWLTWAPLRHIGKVSYGVYLLHGTCAIGVSRIFQGSAGVLGSLEFVVIGSAVSIGVATLSFRYFEMPFLRLKDRFTITSRAPVLSSAPAV